MSDIHVLSAPDSLTLWWELPACPPDRYEVYLDGAACGATGKTHYTIEGLRPGSRYTVEVRPVGKIEAATEAEKRRLDVTKPPFNAAGDGAADDTAALQKALDACGAGDCVYLPAGVYRCGALFGHSDTDLYLDEGAVLQGAAEPEAYAPRIRSRFEGTEMDCYASLLNFGALDHAAGPNCEHIRIRGNGTIRGGGYALAWATIQSERERLRGTLDPALVASCENENTIPGRVRGRLIGLVNCRDVRITGLTLADGPSWNVHMVYSRDIVTDHCLFQSEGIWNGDGWDPDSSEGCVLFGCTFRTQDDSVAIKSGKNPEGNVINRPARHIRVFDCRSEFGHGICIGSEISGGVEDVAIWDCDLANSQYGVMVKGTAKRGGGVKGLTVRRCTAPRVMVCQVGYNDDGIPAPCAPVFRDFLFEDLTLTGQYRDADAALTAPGGAAGALTPCAPVVLEGFDAPGHHLQNAVLRRLHLTGSGAQPIQLRRCAGVTLEDIEAL